MMVFVRDFLPQDWRYRTAKSDIMLKKHNIFCIFEKKITFALVKALCSSYNAHNTAVCRLFFVYTICEEIL